MPERTCMGCGALIPSLDRRDKRWCSMSCYRAAHRKQRVHALAVARRWISRGRAGVGSSAPHTAELARQTIGRRPMATLNVGGQTRRPVGTWTDTPSLAGSAESG